MPAAAFDRLVWLVKTLRSPEGCAWDREQTPETMRPCLFEECAELVDAMVDQDEAGVREELGDLLFLVVFVANLYEERGAFSIAEMVLANAEKMIGRHPHVFDKVEVDGVADILRNWEAIKAEEKGKPARESALDGVPRALPALARAQKTQKKAAKVGFDWPDGAGPLAKLREEIDEFEHELAAADIDKQEEELGDLLFSVVNVARKHGLDAETALVAATRKFERRFREVEKRLAADGKTCAGSTLEEMDAIWDMVKVEERES